MPLKQVCTDIIDCPHESPKWLSDGIPVIRNFNLINGQLDMTEAYYVDEATYNARTRRAVPAAGDIVFSREAPIGNCAIIPRGFQCCLGQRLVLLRVNRQVCSAQYLLAALLSSFVKKQISRVETSGSTVSNFNIGDLGNLIIPIIEKQEAVAKITESLNEQLANNRKIIVTLEKTAKTVFDYWFTQFDFPNDEEKPYRASGGEMKWDDQQKCKIPKGWEAGTVNSIMRIDNNSIDPRKFGDATMEHYSIPAFDDGRYPAFEPASAIESGKYAVDSECILTSKLNPQFKRLWDPYCETPNAICSTEFIVYRPREAWTRPYCYAVLNSDAFYAYMATRETASTGSRKRIQPEVSAAFPIAIPDEQTMRSFVAVYEPIMKQIKNLHKENHELAKLRDWLLPMLMNGQAVVE